MENNWMICRQLIPAFKLPLSLLEKGKEYIALSVPPHLGGTETKQ